MTEQVSIAISTCPNDTFAFHGLLEHKVDTYGFEFNFELADVEALNQRAARGDVQVAKVSFNAALDLTRTHCVLPVGAALGFGVGPILLARAGAPRGPGGALHGRVLAPGSHTTASLLLRLFHPNEGTIEQCVFSEIIPALERGDADYGVCIHEGRFTWQDRGLELVEDLGARWEGETHLPLPLGGIVALKSLGADRIEPLTLAIRESIDYGFEHRQEALVTMRRHAQELADDVLWKHVELYVNADTLALSPKALQALEELGRRAGARNGLEVPSSQALKRIFRIARLDGEATGEGTLRPDGFVHLSFADQIEGTIRRHFSDAGELMLFEIDRKRVRSDLRFEPSRGGAIFPHLYRALEAKDLLRSWPLTKLELPRLAAGAEFDRPKGDRL